MGPFMRTLKLTPGLSPRRFGQAHGELFRHEISSLAAIRIYLTCKIGGFSSEAEVLEVARMHLPVLQQYDQALYDELVGIAEGAKSTPEHIVVLNHYTDLRDIRPTQRGGDGGCSVLWTRSPEGAITAQTWDMHATAIPYVMMMHVPASEHADEAWLFSLTGCLGMCGMNRHGVSVAINNLRSTDGRVGVVWPALVRRALREKTAAAARDIIQTSPIGSGHHYLAADAHSAYGIETSGTRLAIVFSAEGDGAPPYVHTNHCLDSEIAIHTSVFAHSSTYERFNWLTSSVSRAPVQGMRDAWTRLGSTEGFPRSICGNSATPENPHGTATCGAIAMNLSTRQVWGQAGLIHNVEPQEFPFHEPL